MSILTISNCISKSISLTYLSHSSTTPLLSSFTSRFSEIRFSFFPFSTLHFSPLLPQIYSHIQLTALNHTIQALLGSCLPHFFLFLMDFCDTCSAKLGVFFLILGFTFHIILPLKFTSSRLWNNSNMGNCMARPSSKDDNSDHHVDFAAGNVQLITSKESWDQKMEEARKDGKIVIANYSASWCGPCKMIAPYFCELSEKYPSVMFLLIDVDELTDFSTSWDIKATPTFFFLRDGKEIDKLVGANKPELLKKIVAITDSIVQYQ